MLTRTFGCAKACLHNVLACFGHLNKLSAETAQRKRSRNLQMRLPGLSRASCVHVHTPRNTQRHTARTATRTTRRTYGRSLQQNHDWNHHESSSQRRISSNNPCSRRSTQAMKRLPRAQARWRVSHSSAGFLPRRHLHSRTQDINHENSFQNFSHSKQSLPVIDWSLKTERTSLPQACRRDGFVYLKSALPSAMIQKCLEMSRWFFGLSSSVKLQCQGMVTFV